MAQSSKGFTGPRVTTTDEPWLQNLFFSLGSTNDQNEPLEYTPLASPIASNVPNHKPKKLSMMAAALQILQERKIAMTCSEIIELLATEGLWVSPGGKTPASTLYAAISRSVKDLGIRSPFRKSERGKFEVINLSSESEPLIASHQNEPSVYPGKRFERSLEVH